MVREQARRWCFTHHLSGQDPQVPIQEWFEDLPEEFRKRLKYAVMQYERCPSTGRLHVQGALSFKEPTRMANIKKTLSTAHLAVMAATGTEGFDYCQKEESRVPGTEPMIFGSPGAQEERSDLHTAASIIKDGGTLRDVALLDPVVFVRAHKELAALRAVLHPPLAMDRKVGLFWGTTATGKTRAVHDNLSNVYTVFDVKNPWFDGYDGEENVLFDECGPGMMSHNLLKRLLDRYPMTVPIKGSSANWMAKTIILTSNVQLEDWFFGVTKSDYDALKRRMRIFEFPEEKELAIAWLRGELIPSKRCREPATWESTMVISDEDSVCELRRT